MTFVSNSRRHSYAVVLLMMTTITLVSRTTCAFLQTRSSIPLFLCGLQNDNNILQHQQWIRSSTSSSIEGGGSSSLQPLIDLQTFLKMTDLVETGGEAKRLIQEGKCKVNGQGEERRAKKLFIGDVVQLNSGPILNVQKEVETRGYVFKVKVPKDQRPGYTAPSSGTTEKFTGSFRTEEWRAERKEKKYARKEANTSQSGVEQQASAEKKIYVRKEDSKTSISPFGARKQAASKTNTSRSGARTQAAGKTNTSSRFGARKEADKKNTSRSGVEK